MIKLAILSVTTKDKKLISAKIINKYTLEVSVLEYKDIIKVIEKYGIDGVINNSGTIIGSNGTIERYEKSKGRMVILFKTDSGFVVSDNNGTVIQVDNKRAIELALKFGIANGKIVNNNNNIKYISAINGNYEYINEERKVEILNGKVRNKRINKGIGIKEDEQRGNDSSRDNNTGRIQGAKETRERDIKQGHRRNKIYDGLKELGYANKVNEDDFYKYIEKAKNDNPNGASVDLHSVEEYRDMNCITFDNGKGGVAVHDGNIVSVFKHPESKIKKFMGEAMTAAILNGGNKLDCYSINGGLPSMYVRYGFIPVCKIKFNREFAPDNWNYERDGEPDIVFMAYCGDSIEDMKDKETSYKMFSDYTDKEVPYIEDSETECAYDRALEYRENKMKTMEKLKSETKIETNWLSGVKDFKGLMGAVIKGRKI